MDYPRNNTFTFLFSTYKRTAGIAFAAILILAIPITTLLLTRQQDIRQHASEVVKPVIVSVAPVTGSVGTLITITGTGFMPTGNIINFDGTADIDAGTGSPSTDGTILIFLVPANLVGGCVPKPDTLVPAATCDSVTQVPLTTGAHSIVVINSNGASNSIQFTAITSASVSGATVSPTSTASPTITGTSTTPTASPTPAPSAIDSKLFDLNDDGHVNELDLNILYTSFGTREGD